MRQRKSNPGFVVDRLQRKHSDLAYRVEALDGRVYLTDQDQVALVALKREKLATKDALDALRRDD